MLSDNPNYHFRRGIVNGLLITAAVGMCLLPFLCGGAL